jgi:hypothetical protein
MNRYSKIAIILGAFLVLAGCNNANDRVSENLSTAADNFEINRDIVFYNVRHDKAIYQVQGLCALGNRDTETQKTVVCRIGKNTYTKDFMFLSGDVTIFVHQLEPAPANTYNYRVVVRPEAMLPSIEIHTKSSDALE